MRYDLTKLSRPGRVFYYSQPFAISHPDRLATVARLYGLRPPTAASCHVLELGCADGANLIPMADGAADSRFVGVDLSEPEIASGREMVQQLGLSNIRLETKDVLEVDESFGKFDYVICHGMFSWTPRAVQDKILSICRNNLTENGVALVNYNTLPNWHLQIILRDMLRFRAEAYEDPVRKAAEARITLNFLEEWFSKQKRSYGRLMASQLKQLQSRPDGYLFHAFLDVINEPLYFHQFVKRVAEHGLQYLGDAETGLRWSPRLPAAAESALAGLAADEVQREQILDFLSDRASRYSLLCHAKVPLNRELTVACLAGLYLSAKVWTDPPLPGISSLVFRSSTGQSVSTSDPGLQAALMFLGQTWPTRTLFEELQAEVSQRVQGVESDWPRWLLEGYQAGMVQLNCGPSPFTINVDSRPKASRLARLQAAMGNQATSLLHQTVELGNVDRQVLQRLDGQLDQASLAKAVSDLVARGELVLPPGDDGKDYTEIVRDSLSRLAASALLVRDT